MIGWEREEWASAVAEMDEFERVEACGHDYQRNGVCMHCGDDEPRGGL